MTQYRALTAAVLATASLVAAPALAQETSDMFDVSFNVGAATDYVWRGSTQCTLRVMTSSTRVLAELRPCSAILRA